MNLTRTFRRSFSVFLLAVLGLNACAAVYAPAKAVKTEIIVLGTVHQATPRYNEKTLLGILENLRPDILLFEIEPSLFNHTLSFLDTSSDYMESRALATFVKNSEVKVLPYDAEKNLFYKEQDYFRREAQFINALLDRYNKQRLTPEARALFDSFHAFIKSRDVLAAERPEVINSAASDEVLEHKIHYTYAGLKQIIELTPALKKFDAFWGAAGAFWVRRNDEMSHNISRFAQEHRGKRIVVICGFEHRYYLRKKLSEQAQLQGFQLREYWEAD